MKKIKQVLLMALASLVLVSCTGTTALETKEETTVEMTDSKDDTREGTTKLEEAEDFDVFSNGQISFAYHTSWQEVDGAQGVFAADDQQSVYGLNSTSEIGSLSPEAFKDTIAEVFEQEYEILEQSSELSDWNTSDGVSCMVHSFLVTDQSGSYTYLELVMAPDKILFLSIRSGSQQELLCGEI